jgi:ABC-type Mn2+/Zn2+ transport system permease subunit
LIDAFLASWWLFHNTYITGWLIGLLLSLIGVLVVARDQIFIGAAVSQASMLGIALAMWLGSWEVLARYPWFGSDAFPSIAGGLFAVLGALLTGRSGAAGRESYEAVTGWVFLLSGSLAILIVARSPHGLEEVHRLLSSTIIGASRADAEVFGVMVAATLVAVTLWRRRLLLLVMDPEMAGAVGTRVGLWDSLLCIWLGIAVGLSIRVSGMLYTFGCLVLPALVAKNLCREVRVMFSAAAAVSLGAGVVAFVLANYYDYPPGQVAVALLCLLLAAAWGARRLRH